MSETSARPEHGIFIQLTSEQVRHLPAGVRHAMDQLVDELRAAGHLVSATRPLSDIAAQIDELAGSVAANSGAGADLRAALELSADELRIRDVLPTLEWPPGGSCGTISQATWAFTTGNIIILPRVPVADDPGTAVT